MKKIEYSNLSLSQKKDFLYDYCRMNLPKQLKEFLGNNSKSIDITFEDGVLFQVAIAQDMKEILHVLLEYYERTKLQDDQETFEYKSSKHKLLIILQDAVDSCNPSKEIQEILNSYIGDTSDSDSDKWLEDITDTLDSSNQYQNEENNTYIPGTELTANNLKMMTQQDYYDSQQVHISGDLVHIN
jgi:hypothetical protein